MDDNRPNSQGRPSAGPPPEGPAGPPVYRRGGRRYLRLLWLLVLVPVIIVAVQVWIILSPQMRFQTAIQDVMTDSLRVQGYVSMESTSVESSGGVLYFTVDSGQRVSQEGEVAEVYSSAAAAEARASLNGVREELELLQEAQKSLAEGGDVEGYMKQMLAGMYDMLRAVDAGNYADIAAGKKEASYAANKLQIATGEEADFSSRIAALEAKRLSLEAAAVPTGAIRAPSSGYFSAAARDDRLPLLRDALESADAAGLQSLLQAPASQSREQVIGYIITDYRWLFYTTVTAREAERFKEGMKLELRFPEYAGVRVPAEVESLETEGELCKLVLACEYIRPEILQMRAEEAEIVFSEQKGLRIPRQAMRIIEGTWGVYVKFGSSAYFRPIKILVEDESFVLISLQWESGVNEVEMYDEIITDSGGAELYDGKIL